MRSSPAWFGWCAAVALSFALGGCAGSSDADETATGGSGSSLSFKSCGDGVPCSPGSTCQHTGNEGASVSCKCDESNHFFCSTWWGGGGGPGAGCDSTRACYDAESDSGPASCSHDNGYCTRDCVCAGDCTTTCTGMGPAVGPSHACDAECGGGYWTACWYRDGACDYSVQCSTSAPPKITGSCP